MGKGKGIHLRGAKNRLEVHLRTKYIDPSRRFLDWVNALGFEQSVFGRLVSAIDSRLGIRRVAFLTLFCVVLSSLIFTNFDFTYDLELGEVAKTDIKSPISIDLVDELATSEKRLEAEKAVAPVFDFNPVVYEKQFERIYRAFLTMRKLARSTTWPRNQERLEEAIKDFQIHREAFEKELGVQVPSRIFEWLAENRFSARIENILVRALSNWSSARLVSGADKHIGPSGGSVQVRVVRGGSPGEEFSVPEEELVDIGRLSHFSLKGIRGADSLTPRDQRNVLQLAHSLLVQNLSFNLKETDERRFKARQAVLPVQRSIQKNQVIVGEGQQVQPIHLSIIEEIKDLKSARRTELMSLAAALLFVTIILVFSSYLKRFTVNRVVIGQKDLMAIGIVILTVTMITKLFLFLADPTILVRISGLDIPPSAILYLAPVALGPMLVGMLIASGEVVWLYTVFQAAVLAFLVDMNFGFLIVAIVGGIAAGRGVFSCKARNDIYWAGLRTGLVNAVTVFLLTLIQKLGDAEIGRLVLWNVLAALTSGMMASLLAMSLVPLLESWFNYTTDIKLLELASLNHPVMKEMIVKAPGTYHHSLVVGSMCEAAAEEIGANALLAKVMAYYHDIGKTEHAQYFIENQRPGYNPHDHISPHMSKTVLVAHVKDGAEMGIAYRLGKPIIDGILQHHGTTLISFFYNKALEEQDEEIDQVNEEDFRYPGPKPQFREAALVMLADSIEAAARSLDEPTTGRLQNIVRNVIQNKFLDGQLDECNLTLKDLTVIERAFKRVLLGIYHQRIDYPMKHSVGRSGPRAVKSSDKKGNFSA